MAEDSVADRLAITDLLYRYGRAVDRIDEALGYSVWHEDGVADYGAIFQGSGRGFIDFVCESHRKLLYTQHLIGNVIIDLDGDRAGSEAYFSANMEMETGGAITRLSAWGRYLDRWSRRDGRWGIDRRIALVDADEMRPLTPLGNGVARPRDRSDPSYAILPTYPRKISQQPERERKA